MASSIRKQTIISSSLIYIGFFVGFINNFLLTTDQPFSFFTNVNLFQPNEYALTRIFADFGQIMVALGTMGVIPVIYKFYPYFKDNLPKNQIDLLSWGLIISFLGCILILIGGWYFQPLFIKKFSQNSPLILDYYFWLFPFAIGMLFFSVLESFCWAVNKSVVSNFLKETFLRILTSVIIFLYYFKIINFQVFIYCFSLQYLGVFLTLLYYLYQQKLFQFTFQISRVTRKFWKKMVGMQLLIFGGTVIAAVAASIDSLIIASLIGLQATGVFLFAQYAANLIQVPMRSIQAVAAGVLSRAWKDKNWNEIFRIYQRSCINLLLIALLIFGNIWLNMVDALQVFHIQKTYAEGMSVLLIIGLVRVIDAGTGLNAMVINTSTFWRFDFSSGVILLAFRLPLTYYLIKKFGIIGSAYAELIAYSLYNFIRFEFLRRKFNMQPFTLQTVLSIGLGLGSFGITYLLFHQVHGWMGIFLKAGLFSLLMLLGIILGNLTPDARQLMEGVKKRFSK